MPRVTLARHIEVGDIFVGHSTTTSGIHTYSKNSIAPVYSMAATHQLKVEDIFSVKDYVCVVTGGGTGIGLMCSQALAANGVSTASRSVGW